jgi:hypothetical protein
MIGLSGYFGPGEALGRPEMVQKHRSRSITGKAYHIIYHLSIIIYRVLGPKLVRGGIGQREARTHPLPRPQRVGHPRLLRGALRVRRPPMPGLTSKPRCKGTPFSGMALSELSGSKESSGRCSSSARGGEWAKNLASNLAGEICSVKVRARESQVSERKPYKKSPSRPEHDPPSSSRHARRHLWC